MIIDINKLEQKLSKISKDMPKKIKLNKYTEIENTMEFMETHLNYVKTYMNSKISEPYLMRLIEFIELLEKK